MGNEYRHIYPPRVWNVNDSSPAIDITQSGSGVGVKLTTSTFIDAPTGSTIELRINNTAELSLSATDLDLRSNTLTAIGGGTLGGTFGGAHTYSGAVTLSSQLLGSSATAVHRIGGSTSKDSTRLSIQGALTGAAQGRTQHLETVGVLTGAVNDVIDGASFYSEFATASSGTHAVVSQVTIGGRAITINGSAVVTRAASLYVDAPMSGATTANYVAWFDSGIIRWDDPIALGGGSTPTLGTIGGSGPAVAAQNQWLRVDINGTSNFIPVWV